MSQNLPHPCEPEVVTRWPMVWIVGGLTLAFVVVPLVASTLLSTSPAPDRSSAEIVRTRVLAPMLPPAAADARRAAERPAHVDVQAETRPPAAADATLAQADRSEIEVIAQPPRELLPEAPSPVADDAAVASATPRRPQPAAPPQPMPSSPGISPWHEEEVLLENLRYAAVNVGLESHPATVEMLLAEARKNQPEKGSAAAIRPRSDPLTSHLLLDQAAEISHLSSLPFRQVKDCQLDEKAATEMQAASQTFRRYRTVRVPPSGSFATQRGTETLLRMLRQDRALAKQENVSALVQILQVEEQPIRMELVKLLSRIGGPKATAALAHRAVYDVSSEVRQEAIEALKQRSRADCRPMLLEALRYPWAPVAEHAAQALVTLQDREAIPELVKLLAQPPPTEPFLDEQKKWMVREVVRINHFRNCLLCHAASADRRDPVRGLVPEPGKPIAEEYYESKTGDFVRADVTYLKQDFSLMEFVPNYGVWPALQRHDYLVRTRPLTAHELAQRSPVSSPSDEPSPYPQREAVVFVLRSLAGVDLSARTEDWRMWFRNKR